MATHRWLLVSWALIGIVGFSARPHADDPTAAFYGIGQLTGLRAQPASLVRDATQVDGVIYAVGGATTRLCTGTSGLCGPTDTAVLWRFDETTPAIPATLEALPNLATNTLSTTPQTAYAITPDAAFIGSQARTNATNGRQAVRVTTSSLTTLNLHTVFPSPGGLTAATATSSDGTIFYGETNVGTFNPVGGFHHRGVVFDVGLPSRSAFIPFVSPLDTWNPVAERGSSADGSVAVGSSFPTPTSLAPTNHKAYRYVHGSPGVTTAIPLLDGGTFNDAVAVSPDGDLVLVTGDSTANPNGEAYLWRASTDAKTPLGSPNSGLIPGAQLNSGTNCLPLPVFSGGMTADGSVVVMSFFGGSCSGTNGYFWNEHGWFHLTSVLAAHGVDLLADGWDTGHGLQIHGISSDGTLVFGAGVRDGKIEGFVAKFGIDDLASFNPQPVAPADTSLVGVWAFCDPEECDFSNPPESVVVITADGAYFEIGDGGFERGFYTYNGSVLTVTTMFDTNGDDGANDANGLSLGPIVVDGDTLAPGGPFAGFRFAGSVAEPLVGAWVQGNATQPGSSFVTVFLGSDMSYKFFQASDIPAYGVGAATGTYAWAPDITCSPFTHELNIYTPGEPDDLHNCGRITTDGLGLDALDDDGHTEFHFARVIDPASVLPSITNTTLEASGGEDSAFSFTVTALHALTFEATGLPAGLTIDADTGVISGTPLTNGTFNVTVTVTNTFGDTDMATLVLTFAAPPATIYGIRDLPPLPGGMGAVASGVRDATRVNGVIYAVGASAVNNTNGNQLDTPVLWSSVDGLQGLPHSPLPGQPDFVSTQTDQLTAYAITPDAAYIASQAKRANVTGAPWVRVTRSLLPSTTANFDINVAVGPSTSFAALSISDTGSTLYGQEVQADTTRRATRYEFGVGLSRLPLPPDTTWSVPIPRGTSSDGLIMVGAASTGFIAGSSSPGPPFGYPVQATNTTAFRYVHNAGTLTGTTTPLPKLSADANAWSFPIAMSPDGAVTVVAGNSEAYPNGEIYLTNAANTVTATLGSPNTGMTPRLMGGRTADGAIVVTFATDSTSQAGQISGLGIPTGSRQPYVYNGEGWFLLGSILRAHGLDLEDLGWNPNDMVITGVRTVEGVDLLFGQARRRTFNPATGAFTNGAQEGFVIKLPAGNMAAFAAPTDPPADEGIVGAWIGPLTVPVYFADGRFITFTQGTGFYQNGLERGRYSWAANGGEWYPITRHDTNGFFGHQGFNAVLGRIVTVTGDIFRLDNANCNPGACLGVDVPRVVGAPGSVVGAWTGTLPDGPYAGTIVTAVLLGPAQGSRYFVDYDAPGSDDDYFELGTYTFNAATNTMVLTPDGGGGPDPNDATLSRDGLGLLIEDDDFSLQFTRVVAHSTVVPVLATPLPANATVSEPFTYTLQSTYALTFEADGLPDGLSLDSTTGEISGIPTTAGDFTVHVSVTNTFGDSAEGDLLITVRSTQAALLIGAPTSEVYGSTFGVTLGGGSGTGAFSFEVSGGCAAVGLDVTMTSGTVDCTITAHRAGDDQYWEASATHVVDAVQKSASVTPSANGKVYGAPEPSLGGSLSGFLPADGVTAAYSRETGEDVLGSPYLITATLSPPGVLSNYDITYNSAPFTITTATTSTTLTSTPNPSSPGQIVNFVATVTGQHGGAVTGIVTFKRGSNTVLGTATVQGNGTATLPLSTLGNGSHVITAIYGGDSNSTGSTSSSVTQNVVAPAAPTTTTLTSSLNPSIVGQSVTLTATVTSGTPGTITGTVTFRRGQTVLSTETLSAGQATFTTTTLPQGSLSLTAIYSGDSQYITSTSGVLNQVVTMASTTTSLSSSPNPSNGNQLVTLTATISSGTPGAISGTVTFKRGQTVLGTASVSGNQASMTTSTLPAGSSNLTAVFGGDATYTGSTSPAITHVVNTATSTTTLSGTPNPSSAGQNVQFTAVVVTSTGAIAAGQVTLKKGNTTLATATLNASGVATFNLTTLAVGSHNLKAVYAGDAYTSNSTSNTYTQVVQ